MKTKCRNFLLKSRIWADTRGFGMNELLGIAAALIIAGFVIIPGLKGFAEEMLDELTDWWEKTIAGRIFRTS